MAISLAEVDFGVLYLVGGRLIGTPVIRPRFPVANYLLRGIYLVVRVDLAQIVKKRWCKKQDICGQVPAIELERQNTVHRLMPGLLCPESVLSETGSWIRMRLADIQKGAVVHQ